MWGGRVFSVCGESMCTNYISVTRMTCVPMGDYYPFINIIKITFRTLDESFSLLNMISDMNTHVNRTFLTGMIPFATFSVSIKEAAILL